MNAMNQNFGRSPADICSTAGAYMRACRVDAGKSVLECAKAVAATEAFTRDDAIRQIRRMEADQPGQPGVFGLLAICLRETAAFPFDFDRFVLLPVGDAEPNGEPVDVRQTPGAYMQFCRLEAGKSVMDCAKAIASIGDRDRAMRDIRFMEANRPGNYAQLAICLRDSGVFKFDFAKFVTLAAGTADISADPDVANDGWGA